MEVDLSYIRNKITDLDRISDLSKTVEGQKLIAQITASEISRFVNSTEIPEVNSMMKLWRKNFTDIVRPNRFFPVLTAGGERYDLSNFIKSITVPLGNREVLTFKRAGKTIKMPLNIDSPNGLNLTLYQDLDNTVLNELFFLLNEYNYDFVNWNDQDNRDTMGTNLTLYYTLHMHTDLKKSSANFWSKLKEDLLDLGKEMIGRAIVGNTNFEILEKALASDGLQNTGNFETQAKYFDKIGIYKPTFAFTYKNIFIENISDLTFDMERMNNYQEISLNLQYQDVELKVYDIDLKSKKTEVLLNSTNFQNV